MEKTNNTPHDEPMTQPEGEGSYDYTFVTSVARIALYDDLRSAPRVTEIMPASTPDYIEALASTIYNQAKQAGGLIPYTVVREVSENFIHARFTEIIVSILDRGNTIRFADQGPGISDKKKAQLPGFSSAVEPMKGYIRGVGSGLPIVCDYLDFTHGSISIDDNIGQGTVVTISMNGEADAGDDEEHAQVELPVGKYAPKEDQFVAERIDPGTVQPTQPVQQPMQQPMQQPVAPYYPQQGYVPQVVPTYAQIPAQPYLQQVTPQVMQPVVNAYQQPYTQPQPRSYAAPALNPREKAFLNALLAEGPLGVTDLVRLTSTPQATVYTTLKKLQEEGLIEMVPGQKKRTLTAFGMEIAETM